MTYFLSSEICIRTHSSVSLHNNEYSVGIAYWLSAFINDISDKPAHFLRILNGTG